MKKIATHHIKKQLGYNQLAERVYRGDILEFDGGASLIQAARKLCRRVFDIYDIEKAHKQYSRRQFLLRAARAQEEFNRPYYKLLFMQWLEKVGVDIDTNDIYWDTLGLRIAPPVHSHGGGFRSHIDVHRDTWGAGIQSQINWWAPITPVSYKRTMVFYPDYWDRPLANTSAQWSFKEYLEARNKAKKAGKQATYPSAPINKAYPTTACHLIYLECGNMLAFSSAHLHSSVTNSTERTRFSLEIRTVSLEHIKNGYGAPNVDCASTPMYGLFSSIRNNSKLSNAMNPESVLNE